MRKAIFLGCPSKQSLGHCVPACYEYAAGKRDSPKFDAALCMKSIGKVFRINEDGAEIKMDSGGWFQPSDFRFLSPMEDLVDEI